MKSETLYNSSLALTLFGTLLEIEHSMCYDSHVVYVRVFGFSLHVCAFLFMLCVCAFLFMLCVCAFLFMLCVRSLLTKILMLTLHREYIKII